MLILALDSTAETAAAALCRDNSLLAAASLKNGHTHSESLLPMVESLLRLCGLDIEAVDLFACAAGPGSFTGVRIGAATIKGLAYGRGKPCIGVSTLEALAENLTPLGGILCPVMNARRGQVYNALFRSGPEGPERLCADRAISLEELEADLAARGEEVRLCGDGAALAMSGFQRLRPLPVPALLEDQNAASVARCALRAYRRGVRTTDAELVPTYLRLPQAERERLERLGRAPS